MAPSPPVSRRCFLVTVALFTAALVGVGYRMTSGEERLRDTIRSMAVVVEVKSQSAAERLVAPFQTELVDLKQHVRKASEMISTLEHNANTQVGALDARISEAGRAHTEQIAALKALLSQAHDELHTIQQQVTNLTSDVNSGKAAERFLGDMVQIADDLGNVAFALSRLTDLSADATPNDKRKVLNMVRRIRDCDFNCSGHGMSLNLAEVTRGCECVCVGGWTGTQCEKGPADWAVYAQSGTPKLFIPHHREDLPPLNESVPGCKAASKAYYLAHYNSEEFRTDRALRFFWTLARHSFIPSCSTNESQTIMIDIGANIGEQLGDWERELLNLTNCPRNDSLLVLVEPNPQNVAVLRHRVKQREQKLRQQGVASAGSIIVSDSAISYFDGIGRFAVNRKQARAGKGNERGSLDVNSATQSDSTTTVFETRVERLSSLLRSVTPSLVRPNNFTISLLKVDAEGYDPAILYGAFDLLPRTNLVVFECHKLWHNAGFSFRDVAEFFAKSGFQTYKMGLFYWIPVTPPAYWDDVYDETLQWSNCIAVRNGHPFQHMFTLPPPCK